MAVTADHKVESSKKYIASFSSQCRTLVCNTAVRVTFKVNGKPRIVGNRSPLTPWPIDLIFDMGDYVGDMTPQAKNVNNRPRMAGPAKGWNVKVKFGLYFIFIFIVLLARLWRPHFYEDRHRFCARWRVSVGIDFLGVSDYWGLNFSPPKNCKWLPIL